MAQKKQSGGSDRRWLATLIESFETATRSDVRKAPCSRALLRAVRAHLAARKASPAKQGNSRFVRLA
ncbi:hypothetical protein [Rhodopseudomonas telluris]|uniref:Uncharacterized protein n=1 Tax=Rhodopseudomonas telluris TaxID=644215 RepID=A0ABV6EYI8_9BRAD